MHLSLRSRLIAWVTPGVLLVGLGAFLFARFAGQSVRQQEDELWRSQVARGRDHLTQQERSVGQAVRDYAFWDEMVDFVIDPAEPWSRENLGPWLLRYFEIDFVVVLDLDARVIYASDPTGSFSVGDRYEASPLIQMAHERPATMALVYVGDTPVRMSGGTIHHTMAGVFEPPGAGVLLFGQVLSSAYLERISERTGLRVELTPLSPGAATDGGSEEGRRATGATLVDALGSPVGEFSFFAAQSFTQTSIRAFWGLATYFFAMLVVGLGFLVLAADRTLVAPLLALRRAISELRRGEHVLETLPADRGDELGQVAREFASLATDLHNSELSLTKSEDKRLTLLQGIPDIIFLVGRDGAIVEVKPSEAPAPAAWTGLVVGKDVSDVLPDRVAGAVMNIIRQSMEGRESGTLEFVLEHGEAELIYEARVARSDAGEAVVILRDITERRHAEAARERLTAILGATPDFVATATIDGKPRYINPAGRKMLGLQSEDDISELTLRDIAGADDQQRIESEAIPQALRYGAWTGESTIASREGHEVPVSQVVLAHKSGSGAVEFLSTIARDISERKRFEMQLLHLADHDPLTDLFGRKRFREELERELSKAKRHEIPGAVLFVDLDEFKYLNDNLGHRAGDEFLISLSALLRRRVRDSDVVARLGGDEFAILVSPASREDALSAANRVLEAIRRHTVTLNGRPVGLTASLGIALYPEHAQKAEDLLSYADLAMYQSKRNGRNQITFFKPDGSLEAELDARMRGEIQIRDALARGRFLLHAQPIWDLKSNQIEMFELLIRMAGEDGKLIPPGAFLPTAERFGLIQSIDRWVVTRAIQVLADQHQAGNDDLCFAVNLSATAFTDAELLTLIRTSLAETGLRPSSLLFEVTETAAVADTNQAQEFVTALQSMGCRFALDDFGVGFSSLYLVKHLPVDHLKIDGSFVRDLPRNPVDQHLVKAIVEVARALGKKTVAEFVGDEETVRLLRKFGVDYGQGFYLGKPAALSEVLSHDWTSLRAGLVEEEVAAARD